MAEKTAAIVMLYDIDQRTPEGRQAIATWLRRQARFLLAEYSNLPPKKFQARYLYKEEADART